MSAMSKHAAATTIQARVRGRQARQRATGFNKPTLTWAVKEVVAAAETVVSVVDRERLCCDILNTSVMGALVGGFALSNMQSDIGETLLENVIYLCSCLAVHACTCSCLVSALLYRVAVLMNEDDVPTWVQEHKILLKLPLIKFGMGCVSYLLSVILISWRDLDHSARFQVACLIIGVGSMSSCLGTAFILFSPPGTLNACRPAPKLQRVAPGGLQDLPNKIS